MDVAEQDTAPRRTPYDVLARAGAPRRVRKPEVLRCCRELESRAVATPPDRAVAAVQDVRFAGVGARRVWQALAAAGTSVTVYGRDVPAYVDHEVRGVALSDDDPLVDVWAFVVLGPGGRAEAMAANDVRPGDTGEDADRDFDLVTTDDASLVRQCLVALGLTETP